METTNQAALTRAIACADIFELLSIAFAFPNETLAQALLDGSFDEDLRACLGELGLLASCNGHVDDIRLSVASGVEVMDGMDGTHPIEAEVTSADDDPATLLSTLRQEYTRLFLMPGKHALIFPYEAAFRHVAAGRDGIPTLFIAKATKDVERRMKHFGVLPKTARTEPVDSIHQELEFMRFLYTGLAGALHLGDEVNQETWQREIDDFRQSHVDLWLPELMQRVEEETRSPIFRALSQVAGAVLSATARGPEAHLTACATTCAPEAHPTACETTHGPTLQPISTHIQANGAE